MYNAEYTHVFRSMVDCLWEAPRSQPRQGRYPNFDLLRLLLASEVAYAHIWYLSDPAKFDWPGFVMAVPAFLAISGFLVLQSYAESGSWGAFLKKRALRILPALVISLVLALILFGWAGMTNSILNWVTGGIYTREGMANGPLWSLAWEELAYFFLALLWISGAYKRPIFIWLLFIASIVLGATVKNSTSDPDIGIVLFLPSSFLIGNIVYIYRDSFRSTNPIVPWILFFIMISWQHTAPAQMWNGILLSMLQAFSVVWVGMAGLKIIPFKFPDISYSLYVYHYPVVLYLSAIVGIDSLRNLVTMSGLIVIPLCLVSWYLVEKPTLRLKNKPLLQSMRRFFASRSCTPGRT